ncbi:hypothetical protein GCM10023093_26410 [Nemorincola caseinilytica]|uniref:UspA domain-containing protein n=1 Tax=Nemorincola caseinilytica TaxID=2054315 RepID=A0ABP8NK41_9BACT
MSYILAATDNSTTSANAVTYAAALAMRHQMSLVLLHSFVFPVATNDMPMPASVVEDTRADAEKALRATVEKLESSHPGIQISAEVAYGNFLDSIHHYADTHGAPWMLVMGNSNTQEDSAWFFSTLKNASKAFHFPVLAVPFVATYKDVQKICYADDIEQKEHAHALDALRDITLRYGAELHVLNVQEDASLHDEAYDVGDLTKELLADTNPSYHYRHMANVNESIHLFCQHEQIDWLVLMPGEYSFFEGLFHKSHTKALAQAMDIPILLLH